MANKYNAKKIKVDDFVFASKKEADRYCELRMLQRCGAIKYLQLQPKYKLFEGETVQGERLYSAYYIADFKYFDVEHDEWVVEDVKGYKKGAAYNLFKLKKKIMWDKYKILVKEV